VCLYASAHIHILYVSGYVCMRECVSLCERTHKYTICVRLCVYERVCVSMRAHTYIYYMCVGAYLHIALCVCLRTHTYAHVNSQHIPPCNHAFGVRAGPKVNHLVARELEREEDKRNRPQHRLVPAPRP